MGNSIGGRIKELRLLQGMTQEKLAELCDTSVSSIARWESGSLHPNMKHQERLAEIFGMRIDDFYINLDTPVTQDYILSQVLKETQKLDLEEQKYGSYNRKQVIVLPYDNRVKPFLSLDDWFKLQ